MSYSLGIIVMPFSMGANLEQESVIVKGYIDRKTEQLIKVVLIDVYPNQDHAALYSADCRGRSRNFRA